MDWDSHRYLEAYFAVPMMGATLMTVNVRLSPEQILYTLQPLRRQGGAGQRRVRCRCSKGCAPSLPDVQGLRAARRRRRPRRHTTLAFAGEYEALLDAAPAAYRLSRTSTRTPAPRSSTRPAPPACPRACRSATASWCCTRLADDGASSRASAPGQCFRRDDVYMPITPMFHVHAWGLPYVATAMGVKQVYPGRYDPTAARSCKPARRRDASRTACRPSCRCCSTCPRPRRATCAGWKMVIGGSALPRRWPRRRWNAASTCGPATACRRPARCCRTAQLKPEAAALATTTQLALRIKSGLPVAAGRDCASSTPR